MIDTFLSLKEIDENTGTLVSNGIIGTGFILEYKNRQFLISALHNFKDGKTLGLEMRADIEKDKIQLYLINRNHCWHFDIYNLNRDLSQGDNSQITIDNIIDNADELDFCFIPLPRKLKFFQYTKSSDGSIDELQVKVHKFNSDIEPIIGNKYCFSGIVEYRIPDFNSPEIYQDRIIEKNLIFKTKMELKNHDFYIFSAPYTQDYHGCSGAPIMDKGGNLISVVIGGNKEKNLLGGINLKSCQAVLEAALLEPEPQIGK